MAEKIKKKDPFKDSQFVLFGLPVARYTYNLIDKMQKEMDDEKPEKNARRKKETV